MIEQQHRKIQSIHTTPPSHSYHFHNIEQFPSTHLTASNYQQKANIMGSSIYPSIFILQNKERSFLSEYDIPPSYKTIRNDDPRINVYFMAIRKLFVQLKEDLHMRDLWICEKDKSGIGYPILVYFVEPLRYPIMQCCGKVICIEFQHGLSGKIKCTSCNKIAFSFAHIDDSKTESTKKGEQIKKAENKENCMQNKPKIIKKNSSRHTPKSIHKNKHHSKQNNFVTQISQYSRIKSQDDFQLDEKCNEKLYKQYKNITENKKVNIRKVISSNQFRYKSLKKLLGNEINFDNFIKPNQSQQPNKVSELSLSKLGAKQKPQTEFDIGHFVIQMQMNKSQASPNKLPCNQNNLSSGFSSQHSSMENTYKKSNISRSLSRFINKSDLIQNRENESNNEELSETCKEIKSIISALFS